MLKLAKFLSIFFHPLFITFFNYLTFLLFTPLKGAELGFVITLFFLAIVLLPMFYTAAVVYNDNREFHWSSLSDMAMHSRKRLIIYTIIYDIVFLLILLSLNEVFLGLFKTLFASLVMGFILAMIISLIFHLKEIRNSLHALTISFLMTFCFVYTWQVPGFEGMPNQMSNWFLIAGIINALILCAVIWARLKLKAHNHKELVFGILIGILSPIILTLLTYGV